MLLGQTRPAVVMSFTIMALPSLVLLTTMAASESRGGGERA